MVWSLPGAVLAGDSDYNPHQLAEDVTKQGKTLPWWRMGRWSHFSFFSVFVLLFVIPSQGFRLGGCVLLPRTCRHPCSALGMSALPLYL
jgi:hypothetical protein